MKTPKVLSEAAGASRRSMGTTVASHSNFFVAFASGLIIVTGLAIANGKANWWMSSLAILAFFLVIFIFMNARVLIKASLAAIATILIANLALQSGLMLNPYSSIGVVWLSLHMFLFFFLLSISYLSTGYGSRWTGIIYSQLTLIFSGVLLSEVMNPYLGLVISTALATVFFLFYYRGAGRLHYKLEKMPKNFFSHEIDDAFEKVDPDKWSIRKMTSKSLIKKIPTVDYLVWNGEHAYLIHPVDLNSKFGMSPGRKTSKLVHEGHSINPWLLHLVNTRIPVWRTKSAPITLVLLDMDNTNGYKAEAIGVSVPDSPKKLVVGIQPGKGFLAPGKRKSESVLDSVDLRYGQYSAVLSDKQLKALESIGDVGESTYLPEEDPASTV